MSKLASNLPDILAGPLLRLCDRSGVTVWLATQLPVEVSLVVYRLDDKTSQKQSAIGEGKAESVKFGKRLFMTVIRATPNAIIGQRYPVDEVLGYEISLANVSGESHKTIRFDHREIAYSPYSIPTFLISTSLRALYGSCRKLHGPGNDCLASADQAIRETASKAKDRPNVLLLGGDQIYGDDVPSSLASWIDQIATHIVGHVEKMPTGFRKPPMKPYGIRGEVINKTIGLQNEHADNHVLSFGEYAALYLLAWNQECWPIKLERHTKLSEFWVHDRSKPLLTTHRLAKERMKRANEEIDLLKRFYATLPNVKRALANIPSYMIFDDHDVTDDWNLAKQWVDKSRHVISTWMIANAMTAYWAFQGWGNQPQLFGRPFQERSVALLQRVSRGSKPASQELRRKMESFSSWDFVVGTNPPVLFVDTRTKRSFPKSGWPARLISRQHYGRLMGRFKELRKFKTVVLVSPAPVIGYGLIESVQKIATKVEGPFAKDWEPWIASARGYDDLLSFLTHGVRLLDVIILSGDVHYGFIAAARLNVRSPSRSRGLRIIQCVSSACKNSGIEGALNKILTSASSLLSQEPLLHESSGRHLVGQFYDLSRGSFVPWRLSLKNMFAHPGLKGTFERRNNLGVVTYDKGVVDHAFLLNESQGVPANTGSAQNQSVITETIRQKIAFADVAKVWRR